MLDQADVVRRVESDSKHVPLDLSLPFNAGELPQCWTCGLPWPESGACSGVPNDEQLATMLEDPDSWAHGLAHEVRRLRGLPDDASRQTEPPPEHGGPCIRSIDPDGKPLHYCAECYQDMPTTSGQTS